MITRVICLLCCLLPLVAAAQPGTTTTTTTNSSGTPTTTSTGGTPPPLATNTGSTTTSPSTAPTTHDRDMGLDFGRSLLNLVNRRNEERRTAAATTTAPATTTTEPSPSTPMTEEPATETPSTGVFADDAGPDEAVDGFFTNVEQAINYLSDLEKVSPGQLEAAAEAIANARGYANLDDDLDVSILFESYAVLAEAYFLAEDYELADETLRKGTELVDDYVATHGQTEEVGELLAEVGNTLYHYSYTESANNYLYQALQIQPYDGEIAMNLSSSLALDEQTEQALDFLEYALQLGYHASLAEDGLELMDEYPMLVLIEDEARFKSLREEYGF